VVEVVVQQLLPLQVELLLVVADQVVQVVEVVMETLVVQLVIQQALLVLVIHLL
jgi:hypothetical protein